jgi:hypothetical protein
MALRDAPQVRSALGGAFHARRVVTRVAPTALQRDQRLVQPRRARLIELALVARHAAGLGASHRQHRAGPVDWRPGTRFPVGQLTDPQGFIGVDGAFRFNANGLTDRMLEVQEIEAGKFVTISPAPTQFAK